MLNHLLALYWASSLESAGNLSGLNFAFIISLFEDCQMQESPSVQSVFIELS